MTIFAIFNAAVQMKGALPHHKKWAASAMLAAHHKRLVFVRC
jgi:hypothetical protein